MHVDHAADTKEEATGGGETPVVRGSKRREVVEDRRSQHLAGLAEARRADLADSSRRELQ